MSHPLPPQLPGGSDREQSEGPPHSAKAPEIPAQDTPHHRLAVHGRLAALTLDFQATLTAPWTVLFGPSGSGKSSLLRTLAGLVPTLNHHLDRQTNNHWQSLADIPPERRHLAYAPQQVALFPHLTVRKNIDFARSLRPPSPAHQALAEQALHLLNLESLADRLPRNLSGGERQRVSLARALAVPDAHLLLLDEPFAGVDRALRDTLLPRLQTHLAQRQIPVLSVTHDVDETLLLQAEIIRLHKGQNTAQGPATEVLAQEISRLRTLLKSFP